MGIYSEFILPPLVDWTCSHRSLLPWRQAAVSKAFGYVIEIGAGSGLNFSLYDWDRIEHLWAVEPAVGMRKRGMRKQREPSRGQPIEWLPCAAEDLALPAASIDAVVMTFTLCSVQDVAKVLARVRELLKPEGALYFCEHGLAPDVRWQRWQRRLNPLWSHVAGGCQLTRPVDRLLRANGFDIVDLRCDYVAGLPKFAGYLYGGSAKRLD